MRLRFARQLLITSVALAMAAAAAATPPPPPPPPRPFDDISIAERYEAWEESHEQIVYDASSKLARARFAIRGEAGPDGVRVNPKVAAKDFATARRKTLDSLRELSVIYDKARPSASAGDLQRLKERLSWGYEWFTYTEANTLEILNAITN